MVEWAWAWTLNLGRCKGKLIKGWVGAWIGTRVPQGATIALKRDGDDNTTEKRRQSGARVGWERKGCNIGNEGHLRPFGVLIFNYWVHQTKYGVHQKVASWVLSHRISLNLPVHWAHKAHSVIVLTSFDFIMLLSFYYS